MADVCELMSVTDGSSQSSVDDLFDPFTGLRVSISLSVCLSIIRPCISVVRFCLCRKSSRLCVECRNTFVVENEQI